MRETALSLLALLVTVGAALAQSQTRATTQLTTNLVPPRNTTFESYGSWNICSPKRPVAGDAQRNTVHTARLVHMTYMVFDAAGTAIYEYRRSTDGGYTWSAPQTLFTHQQGETMFGEDTRLACWDDEVYFVFTSTRGNANGGQSLFVLGSDDQGQNWQGPLLLSTGTATNLVDVDAPEISATWGFLHVVFEADSTGITNEDVYYTSARFVGGTLSTATPETRVNTANSLGSTDVDVPTVASDFGVVTIAWLDDRLQPGTGDANNLFSKTSTANGTDFATVTERNHTNFTVLTPGTEAPACAVANPNVYVLAMDQRTSAYDELNLYVSNDQGMSYRSAQVNIVAPTADVDDIVFAAQGSRVVVGFNDDRSGANDTFIVVDQNAGADILGGTQIEHQIGVLSGIWVTHVDLSGDVIAVAFEECDNPGNDALLSYSVDGGQSFVSVEFTRGGTCRRNRRDVDEPRVAVTQNRDVAVVWASEPLAGGNALNRIFVSGTKVPVLHDLTRQNQGVSMDEISPNDVNDLALLLLSFTGTSFTELDASIGFGLNLTADSLTIAGLGNIPAFLTQISPGGASWPAIPNLTSLLGQPVWTAALTWDLTAGQFVAGTDPVRF